MFFYYLSQHESLCSYTQVKFDLIGSITNKKEQENENSSSQYFRLPEIVSTSYLENSDFDKNKFYLLSGTLATSTCHHLLGNAVKNIKHLRKSEALTGWKLHWKYESSGTPLKNPCVSLLSQSEGAESPVSHLLNHVSTNCIYLQNVFESELFISHN